MKLHSSKQFCFSSVEVDVGSSCGETITLGEKTKNGFINLFDQTGPPDSMPDKCEVFLTAKEGLSLHIRFIVSISVSSRATSSVVNSSTR